jgi:hypothetical protein
MVEKLDFEWLALPSVRFWSFAACIHVIIFYIFRSKAK